MIVDNEPYVLEFNVRFGDPETQAILPRLKTDLLDIIEASLNGTISEINVEIDKRVCVSVVCASEGYPGSYKKSLPIEGLGNKLKVNDVIVFHAGTKITHNATGRKGYETNGGRVLAVTAVADNIKQAISKAYEALSSIHFTGMQYRKDIGFKALERIKS